MRLRQVEVPTEVAAPERWRWPALTFQEWIACLRVLHGRGGSSDIFQIGEQ